METLTLNGPDETLVLIPHALGYRPRHHLVFLALDFMGNDASGERSRLGPMMSIDLTRFPLSLDMGEAIAETIAQFGVRSCVLALYVEDVGECAGNDTWLIFRGIAARAEACIADSGGGFIQRFVADDTVWARDTGDEIVPQPWRVLESSEIAARLVYEGSSPEEADPMMEVAIRSYDERERAAAIGEQWIRAQGKNGERRGAELWTELLAGGEATLQTLARANAALRYAAVRDRVLLHVQLAEGFLPLEEASSEDVAKRTREATQQVPHIPKAEAVLRLLDQCAGVACSDDAHAYAAAAYVAWWMGRNSWASYRNVRALEADMHHRLARLLARVLCERILPPWTSVALL